MTRSQAIERLLDLREEAKQQPQPSPSEVARIIERLCEQEGVTFGEYMKRKAFIESRFNPLAMNKSSHAAGLFQIMPFNCVDEWERNEDFNPFNAGHNTLWTINFTESNVRVLDSRGFKVSLGTLYLAHQQGAGGASMILRGAARGMTIAQLPDEIERNVKANIPSGVRLSTCAEFVTLWERRMVSAVIPNETVAINDSEDEDDESPLV
jgi:hypothetical protein